jgi:tRNA (cytidine/uridine-2'-O-)-methyltransferase
VESTPSASILQSNKTEKSLSSRVAAAARLITGSTHLPAFAALAPQYRPAARQRHAMRIALFEPDIPQNAGTILRTAACLGVAVDLIEPAGFVLSDRQFRRAGLDYLDRAVLTRFASWPAYRTAIAAAGDRLVLLTTRAETVYTRFRFRPGDVLLLGREQAGVPDAVHAVVPARVRIPLAAGCRSLNVAVACAMVLGEALRQTGPREWPPAAPESES